VARTPGWLGCGQRAVEEDVEGGLEALVERLAGVAVPVAEPVDAGELARLAHLQAKLGEAGGLARVRATVTTPDGARAAQRLLNRGTPQVT
jgi:hypothetical protein